MLQGYCTRNSNNCLQAEAMDLLYGVFTLRTVQCPIGWDGDQSSGIRVVWALASQSRAEVYRGKTKVP